MTALMGQTLESKEQIIKSLEEELAKEQKRRKQFTGDYKKQVKEFELDKKALDNLKKRSDILEKKQTKDKVQKELQEELDMVPTREKAPQRKVPKKYQLQDHPIFFKNSKIQSRIPKPSITMPSSTKSKLQSMNSVKSISQKKNSLIPRITPQGQQTATISSSTADLQREADLTHQVLSRLRDTPNSHISSL